MNYEKDLPPRENPNSNYMLRAIDDNGISVRIPYATFQGTVTGRYILERYALVPGNNSIAHPLQSKFVKIRFQDSATGGEGIQPGVAARTTTHITVFTPIKIEAIDIIIEI